MKYPELIQFLFQLNQFGGVKLGLDNCLRMSRALNYPERQFSTVHVAGTNGKGSTATKIAHALQKEGYKVGLYTSPHISCFRERMKINGEMISEQDIEDILPNLIALKEQEKIPCTFFEMATMLAFVYFAREKVDFAVLETGLGGRLDATNIVSPVLSIITSISLEHTEILGTEIDAIAREKGGIIKPGVPILIGPCVPLKPIEDIAKTLTSPLIQVEGNYSHFEAENCAIARRALELMGLKAQSIESGLSAVPPCRFEMVREIPPVILDVAHNPDGLLHLFSAVRQKYLNEPLRIVFGLSKTKDVAACIEIIRSYASAYHLVEAPNGRGIPPNELRAFLKEKGIPEDKIAVSSNISQSIQEALLHAYEKQEVVIICGSFFIMGEARHALGIMEEQDPIDMNERSMRITTSI